MKKFSTLVLAFALGQTAWAFPEPGVRRLIEIEPGNRVWADATEMQALKDQAHEGGHCGGFIDVTDSPELVPQFVLAPFSLADRVPTQQVTVRRLIPMISTQNLMMFIQKFAAYKNRYYKSDTGLAAAQWLADQYKMISRGRTDIQVELIQNDFKQPSVVARILGKGIHKNERVVIGGHIDSISRSTSPTIDAIAPGADDDASGSATVFEAFRVLVQSGFNNDRTLEFYGYAGEEAGLLGSQRIANSYATNRTPVYSVMQFDMTMYPGAAKAITFMTDFTNADLNRFSEKLVQEYVGIPFSEGKCGYGCSDHASWTRAGYPSTMPFESTLRESNPKIHTFGDTVALLNPAFGTEFAKLAVSYLIELASGN